MPARRILMLTAMLGISTPIMVCSQALPASAYFDCSGGASTTGPWRDYGAVRQPILQGTATLSCSIWGSGVASSVNSQGLIDVEACVEELESGSTWVPVGCGNMDTHYGPCPSGSVCNGAPGGAVATAYYCPSSTGTYRIHGIGDVVDLSGQVQHIEWTGPGVDISC